VPDGAKARSARRVETDFGKQSLEIIASFLIGFISMAAVLIALL
jgi:hypothetical protein